MTGNTTQTHTYTWWSPDGVNMVPVSTTNPLPVNATVTATAETVAVATASPPTYTEGSTDSLSMDLSGNLRVTGSFSASTTANASASPPSYSAGSQPLSQDLSGHLRCVSEIDQSTPGSTNAVDATNFPVTVDVNTGNATASTPRVVLASNQPAVAVTGTFFQTTQPVSAASLPLPSGASTSALQTTGNTSLATIAASVGATGSAVPSDASYQGLLAKTSNPSAATDGNLVGPMADKLGRQVIVIGNVRDNKSNQYTSLASASETTVVTAVASTFLDIYGLIAANTTASAVTLVFKDSTGGTTQFELQVPAGDTRGFMLPSSDGYKQTTVNTNWTCTGGASGVNISVLYVKNI